ncbi:MAG: DUF7601 domain-containing protein [Raoultibacter sp.]
MISFLPIKVTHTDSIIATFSVTVDGNAIGKTLVNVAQILPKDQPDFATNEVRHPVDPDPTLVIEKKVVGLDNPSDQFSFLLEVDRGQGFQNYSGPYTLYSNASSQGTPAHTSSGIILLKHDEYAVIPGFLVNDVYRVTEQTQGWSHEYEVSISVDGATPALNREVSNTFLDDEDWIVFTNTVEPIDTPETPKEPDNPTPKEPDAPTPSNDAPKWLPKLGDALGLSGVLMIAALCLALGIVKSRKRRSEED